MSKELMSKVIEYEADLLYAPWTDEQVEALQKWQEDDTKHPYTCVCGESLAPYNSGWKCEYCGHTQNWCWNFSTEYDRTTTL